MKKNVIFSKNFLLVILIAMVFGPGIRAEGSIGNYAKDSQALYVNPSSQANKESLPILGAAVVAFIETAALMYAAGYIVGTTVHHAVNGFVTAPNGDGSSAYNLNDFSTFDN